MQRDDVMPVSILHFGFECGTSFKWTLTSPPLVPMQ